MHPEQSIPEIPRLIFITSAEDSYVFLQCLVDGLLVCDQDNTKTAQRIPTKLGQKMGLGSE